MVKHKWGVIYKLTNKNNGKYYFGKTVDYKNRMYSHKHSKKISKTYLSRAINKHGWENFTKEIIVENILCRYITTKPNGRKVYDESELNRLEKQHIFLFQSDNSKYGYNITKGGDGSSGLIHSNETKKKMTMSTKKHDAEKGCISYNKKLKKWKVESARPQKKYIGYYNTKERATEALNFYNETGKILPSDLSTRRKGSGSICFIKKSKKWQVYSAPPKKYIGHYLTEEKATDALNFFNETGKRMKPEKPRRKGSITLTKSNKYEIRYKKIYIGRFNTKELAEEALEKYLKKNNLI
ncbi:MAG: hypothetical protein CMF41_04260 [Legionellales bacterium]|nr:hypothetical protein [Legionellales bacterium]